MTFSSAPISPSLASGGGAGILAKTVELFGHRRRDFRIVSGDKPIARRHGLVVGSLKVHLRRQEPTRHLHQMGVVYVGDDALEAGQERVAGGVQLKDWHPPASPILHGVQ